MNDSKVRTIAALVVCLMLSACTALVMPNAEAAPHPYPWRWIPPYSSYSGASGYLPPLVFQCEGIQTGYTHYYQTFDMTLGKAHLKDKVWALYVAEANLIDEAGVKLSGPPSATNTRITVQYTWYLNSAQMTASLTENLGVKAWAQMELTLEGKLVDKATGQTLTAPGHVWTEHTEWAPCTNKVVSISGWTYTYSMIVTNAVIGHGYDVYGWIESETAAWAGVGTTSYVTVDCYATLTQVLLIFG